MMFNRILVPLDGSSVAECTLPHAIALARACEAQVTLVRALQEMPMEEGPRAIDPVEWCIKKAEAVAYLGNLAARLQGVKLKVDHLLLEGQPEQNIVEFARAQHVDLIVLSSHGRSGLSPWTLSSVAQKIALNAHISTLIVRAYQPVITDLADLRYQRVLVPLDGSQRAEHVLPLATTLARFYRVQLLLGHVVRKPEMACRTCLSEKDHKLATQLTEGNRQVALSYLKRLQSRLPLDTEIRLLVSNDVALSLHELIEREKVDLVILSAHGFSGKTKWPFGNVTTNFILYGPVPLLILQDLSYQELDLTQAEVAAKEAGGH